MHMFISGQLVAPFLNYKQYVHLKKKSLTHNSAFYAGMFSSTVVFRQEVLTGLKRCLVVKNGYCSCTGLEFGSWHPYQEALNHL